MKLSVFMPTIRTHLLEKWYESLEKSCSRHDFEVILCGPFDIPESLKLKDNITFIKSFASPTVCAQLCLIQAKGDYLYHTVDDALFYPETISDELDRIDSDTIVAMRYREGGNYEGELFSDNYWYCSTAYGGYPNIDDNWGHCVHFLLSREKLLKSGGFNCKYHYLNHATHCLLFRLQKHMGMGYRLSKSEITTCSHQPGTSGDHASIHHAQIDHDAPLFFNSWFHKVEPLLVDINNWKDQPNIWSSRFSGKERSYEEMYK
jgi:hypothetical protein